MSKKEKQHQPPPHSASPSSLGPPGGLGSTREVVGDAHAAPSKDSLVPCFLDLWSFLALLKGSKRPQAFFG